MKLSLSTKNKHHDIRNETYFKSVPIMYSKSNDKYVFEEIV